VIPLRDNIRTTRFPVVTVLLILANIIVFGWQLGHPGDKASNAQLERLGVSQSDENALDYGAIPYRLTHPGKECSVGTPSADAGPSTSEVVCQGSDKESEARQRGELVPIHQAPWWVTVFSSMFMHGGLLHIGFNMLFLWIFGNNVEDAMGRLKFLVFYLLAGIAALYAQAAIDPSATTPTIGASGAIAGVLGGYAMLYPKARVLTLVFIIFFITLIEIPALVMLGIWFVLQFLPAIGQLATPEIGSQGGVAYFAHVGGFVFGLALVKLFASRHRQTPYQVA
jgi:membrane associated rhomboid family serine protease